MSFCSALRARATQKCLKSKAFFQGGGFKTPHFPLFFGTDKPDILGEAPPRCDKPDIVVNFFTKFETSVHHDKPDIPRPGRKIPNQTERLTERPFITINGA
jgi:hypothetical protein